MKFKEFTLADNEQVVQIRTFGAPLLEERISINSSLTEQKPRYITRTYFLAKVNGFVRILKCTKGLTLILSSPDVINRVANVKIGNIDDMLTYTLQEVTPDCEYEVEDILRIQTIQKNLYLQINL